MSDAPYDPLIGRDTYGTDILAEPIPVDDLPPKNDRRGGAPAVWWEPCEALKQKPGEWHILRKGVRAQIAPACSNLRYRRVRYPEGRFEFETRYDPDFPDTTVKMVLYARYLGPEEDGPGD